MTYNGQIKGFEYLNQAPGKDVLPSDQARDLTQTVRSLYSIQSELSAKLDDLITQTKAHITDYHNPHQLGDDFLDGILKQMFYQTYINATLKSNTAQLATTLDEFVAKATANPTAIPELIRAWQLGTLSVAAFSDDLFETTGAELVVQGCGPIAYWESPFCDPFYPLYSMLNIDYSNNSLVLSVYSPSRRDGSAYSTTLASLAAMVPYGTYPGQFTVPNDHYIRWSLRPEDVPSAGTLAPAGKSGKIFPMLVWSNASAGWSIMVAIMDGGASSDYPNSPYLAEVAVIEFGKSTQYTAGTVILGYIDNPDILMTVSDTAITVCGVRDGMIVANTISLSVSLMGSSNQITLVTNSPVDYDQTYMSEYEPGNNNTWTGTTPIPPGDRPQYCRTDKLGIYGGIPSVPTLYSFLGSQSTGA